MIDYLLTVPVVLLLATSVLLIALHRVLPVLISVWAAAVAVALAFLVAATLWFPLQSGPLVLTLYEWSPVEGFAIPLALRVDGFSHLLLLLSLLASFTVLYSQASRRGLGAWARGPAMASAEHIVVAVGDDGGATEGGDVASGADVAEATGVAEVVDVAKVDALETPSEGEPRQSAEVSCTETLAAGWTVALVAAVALLLLAGNGAITYFAWTIVGLCAFAGELSAATSDERLQSARRFVVVDLLAGYSLLAGVALSWSTVGNSFPGPSTLLAPNGVVIVVLWIVPALVRSLQYPFSRLVVLGEQTRSDHAGLLQALVFAIGGGYLLLRALAPLPVDGGQLRTILLILATFTVVYGLVMMTQESGLERLTSWAMVVGLGLATACFAVGGFAVTVAGLVILVTHVLGLVALGIALEGRRLNAGDGKRNARERQAWGIVLALAAVSTGGLPPLAGFWGYWTMANVGANQGHELLFLLPVVSLPLMTWRMLRAVDVALVGSGDKDHGRRWSLSSGALPIVVLALAAVFPSALVQELIEPAVRAATSEDGHLISLAVVGEGDAVAGWLSALVLCVLLGMVWLVWRSDPIPEMKKRLGLAATPSAVGRVSLPRAAISPAGESTLTGLTARLLSQPEHGGRSLGSAAFSIGRVLGLAAEGVEDRYFAPAMVIVVVVVLLVFLG